jgi:AcrR family transcriptional regulator
MESEMGLRELKKARTRQLIQKTAWRLFAERGFEDVTIAEIARAAEVAEKTVFNYFPTKEDLVFSRLEGFEAQVLDAVRDRKPGESVLEAFVQFVAQPRRLLAQRGARGNKTASQQLRAGLRMITSSPGLLAREQQIYARQTDALAAQLREETGASTDDPEPWIAANAMMGIHRTLVHHVRTRSLAGVSNRRIAGEIESRGKAGLALLKRGLGRYAVKARR